MSRISIARIPLVAHPAQPSHAVRSAQVEVFAEEAALSLEYRIAGDPDALRIPGPDAGLDPMRLWAHTCGELFVAPAGGSAYVEYNFSPSGQAARFAFEAYRERTEAETIDIEIAISRLSEGTQLRARVPLRDLGRGPASMSLTAVIEDARGGLSYWAVHHPGDRPDFHHRDGFALTWTADPVPRLEPAPTPGTPGGAA